MNKKQAVRENYRRRRQEMTPEQIGELSAQICARITRSEAYQKAQYLYAYAPLGSEADIRPVVRRAWREGKRVAFPRVCNADMDYYEVHDFAGLSKGTFGVMEPEGGFSVDWECALVLVPGVAFDADGGRMGYGKGYYDRYFADRSACVLMGVAYELQMAARVPTEAHDRKMDLIVTEQAVYGSIS